jgi:hypothetical protein
VPNRAPTDRPGRWNASTRAARRPAATGVGVAQLAWSLKQQLVAIEAIRRLDTPAPIELRERIERAIREAEQA